MTEIVEVMRVIVYRGERKWVESTVAQSLHGKKIIGLNSITAVTIHEFPQVIQEAKETL